MLFFPEKINLYAISTITCYCFFSNKIMSEVKWLVNVNLSGVYFISEERFNYAKFKTADAEGV